MIENNIEKVTEILLLVVLGIFTEYGWKYFS